MRIVGILGLSLLGLLFSLPAQALSISNTDPKPHTIKVTAGGGSSELTIEPGTAIKPPCDKGCTVELQNGELYELSGGEEVSIDGGVIFVDAAPQGDGDGADSASAPPADAPQAQ